MTETDTEEAPDRRPPSADEFLAVQASPQFQDLRNRLRRFVVPMTALFLVWYLTYVVLGAYAHDFMATPVFGNVNLGILLGLAQFVTTFVITHLYVAHANKRTDPIADEMRNRLEHHEYAGRTHGDGTSVTGGASRGA